MSIEPKNLTNEEVDKIFSWVGMDNVAFYALEIAELTVGEQVAYLKEFPEYVDLLLSDKRVDLYNSPKWNNTLQAIEQIKGDIN